METIEELSKKMSRDGIIFIDYEFTKVIIQKKQRGVYDVGVYAKPSAKVIEKKTHFGNLRDALYWAKIIQWWNKMLKAGLGNKGLEMPEDWDSLSEDEKERRLNGAIGNLKEKRK